MNATSPVIPTIEDVISFLEAKAATFDIKPDTVRQNVMGIRQLLTMLVDDEPRDLQWVKDNLPTLIDRFARKNAGLSGDTAKTYGSRARTSIEEFEKWSANPAGYKWKSGKEAHAREPKKLKVVPLRADHPTDADDSLFSKGQAIGGASETVHTFPFPDGRTLRIAMPTGAWRMADAHRVFCFLATMAEDFEPPPVGGLTRT